MILFEEIDWHPTVSGTVVLTYDIILQLGDELNGFWIPSYRRRHRFTVRKNLQHSLPRVAFVVVRCMALIASLLALRGSYISNSFRLMDILLTTQTNSPFPGWWNYETLGKYGITTSFIRTVNSSTTSMGDWHRHKEPTYHLSVSCQVTSSILFIGNVLLDTFGSGMLTYIHRGDKQALTYWSCCALQRYWFMGFRKTYFQRTIASVFPGTWYCIHVLGDNGSACRRLVFISLFYPKKAHVLFLEGAFFLHLDPITTCATQSFSNLGVVAWGSVVS